MEVWRRPSQSEAALKSEWEKIAAELCLNLDMEVGIMVSRMEKIEMKMAENEAWRRPFDPDVSLIVVGLPQADGVEDVVAKVNDLLHNGLCCELDPEVVAVERQSERTTPGACKSGVEDSTRQSEGVTHEIYDRVYVSSAESLLDYKFRTLLREIPAGKHYYLAANG